MNRYQKILNRKMDRIKEREELGIIKKHSGSRALRKMVKNRLSLISVVVLFIIVVMCFCAPLFTRYDPLKMDIKNTLQSPSSEHILGTDKIGRDIFSRILYGGRMSIGIGFGSALGTTIVGVAFGCYAGYKGGWLDKIVLRVSEMFMAFPQIILILLFVTLVGQSVFNLVTIFILTSWGSAYRMVRSQVLSLREEEFVQALQVFGINDVFIAFKYILPNVIGPIAVNFTINVAMFILNEAALSFLGLGVPLEIPTWGNILNVANNLRIIKTYWWLWFPVGVVISAFVLCINFIGDGLRDSTDPTQQG